MDFYIPTEKMAIQVSYSLQDEATYKREVNALLKISRVFETDTLYIITNDEEKTIEERGWQIKVIPIYKWLLDNSIQ
ncbi:hypothetical protein [Parabacteroides sp.]